MTEDGKTNYLVYEGNEIPVPETRHGFDPSPVSKFKIEFNTVPFCVNAADEYSAAMSVMRKTRRISQYAVVPCVLIDMAMGLDDDTPKPDSGMLTINGSATEEPAS